MSKINLAGKEYEHFKVLSKNEERTKKNGRNTFWNCQCECGKIFIDTTNRIKSGQRKSCGCLKGTAHLQDITGQQFGELTVIERDLKHPQHGKKVRTYWLCKCSCGNLVSVSREHLINRSQSSCGCKGSIGELHINQLLTYHNIKYRTQYTSNDLKTIDNGYLRFDFAILDDNNNVIRLIEFDGPQHNNKDNYFNKDDKIQLRDEQKNQYARDKQIPLVRIPYYKRDCLKLEDLIGDQFLV